MTRKSVWLFPVVVLLFVSWATFGLAKPPSRDQLPKPWQPSISGRLVPPSAQELRSTDELDEVVLNGTFDDSTAWPDGWEVTDETGNGTWVLRTEPIDPWLIVSVDDTPPYAYVDLSDQVSRDASLITESFSMADYVQATLEFDTNGISWGNATFSVDASTDNGATWTTVESWMETLTGITTLDLSSYIAGADSARLRFHVVAFGAQNWSLDNIVVTASTMDTHPPVITMQEQPRFGFGMSEVLVRAIVEDASSLSTIELDYGLLSNGSVAAPQTMRMSLTHTANQYEAWIPAVFQAGDSLAYAVHAVDDAGNESRSPENAGQWYATPIFDPINNYQVVHERSYNWLEVNDTVPLGMGDDSQDSLFFSSYDGIDSFIWYGQTYDHVYVASNGYITLVPMRGATTYIPDIPSTLDPNGMIAVCGTDLNPASAGSGQVYAGMVDGKFVVEYDSVAYFAGDAYARAQIVLDPATNQVEINIDNLCYQADSTYTSRHAIGFESPTGELGGIIYQGDEYDPSFNQSSYLISPPAGSLEGTVYAEDGVTTVGNAEVYVYTPDMSRMIAQVNTDRSGHYTFPLILNGTWSVQVIAAGFEQQTAENVTVGMQQTTTQDFTLVPVTTTTDVYGHVTNDDAAGAPAEGVRVVISQLDTAVVTDADGNFDFGQLLIGRYSFYLTADPIGSNGFHETHYSGVDIVENNPELSFAVNQILPPTHLNGFCSDTTVSLAWAAPANHLPAPQLAARAEYLRNYLATKDNIDPETEQEMRDELSRIEHRMERGEGANELDELSDFSGYKIKMNGVILDTLITDTSCRLTGLVNGEDYWFQVAAEYGYRGRDSYVFSDSINMRPAEVYTRVSTVDYEWFEIDPAQGGMGTPLNLGDDQVSQLLDIHGTFGMYGNPFTQIKVSSNGAMTFDDTFWMPSTGTIPSSEHPNNIIAPFWADLAADSTMGENVWYWWDEDDEWFIIEWKTEPFADENVLKFQVLIDVSSNTVQYNYHSATDGWTNTNLNPTIGVEDGSGLVGTTYSAADIVDGTSIRFNFMPLYFGTLEGQVAECYDGGVPIAGAEIWTEEFDRLLGYTDENGSFSVSAPAGQNSLHFEHPNYQSLEGPVVEVTDGDTTEVANTIFMTRPELSVTPTSVEMIYYLDGTSPSTATIELSNTGCGPLNYTARVSMVNTSSSTEPVGPVANELDEMWDNLLSFNVPVSFNPPTRSAFIADDGIFVNTDNNPYQLYRLNMDGDLVDTQALPDEYVFCNQMAFDPTTGLFYTSAAHGDIYRLSTDLSTMEVVGNCNLPGGTLLPAPAKALAYDWDNNVFYGYNPGFVIAHVPASFHMYDATADSSAELLLPQFNNAELISLTYVPFDEDGYTIWALFDEDGGSNIYRFSPAAHTWDEEPVHQVYSGDDYISKSLSLTNSINTYSQDFVTMRTDITSNATTLDAWQGNQLQHWLSVDVPQDSIEVGGSHDLTIVADPNQDPSFEPYLGQEVMATIDINGPYFQSTSVLVTVTFLNGADENAADLPTKYALHQNYPNPFNPTTSIKFDLVKAQTVHLTVYNMLGQEVMRLVDGQKMEAGFHAVNFDGSRLASGVYFYRIDAGNFTSLKKMVLVK